jgi:invasion protein IalB
VAPPPPADTTPEAPAPAGDPITVPQTDVPSAVVSLAPPAQGEPPVRSTHGDWQVRCDTPAGAQSEQCVLMQFVTAEDRENVGLTVIILKTADKQARIMRILAPLGVLLPSGLGLKIDDADLGRAGFVRCLPNGCVAEVILEDDLLQQLGTGQTATFIIFQTPEEGIGVPISLAGFGEGFDALP